MAISEQINPATNRRGGLHRGLHCLRRHFRIQCACESSESGRRDGGWAPEDFEVCLTYIHTCIYIYIIIMIYIYMCVYIYIFAQIQSESNMAHIFSNFEVRCQLVFIPGKSSFFICMYIYIHTLTSFNHQVYLLISCHQLRSTKKCISWTHMVSIRKQQHIF